jgi:hypothetical protein
VSGAFAQTNDLHKDICEIKRACVPKLEGDRLLDKIPLCVLSLGEGSDMPAKIRAHIILLDERIDEGVKSNTQALCQECSDKKNKSATKTIR